MTSTANFKLEAHRCSLTVLLDNLIDSLKDYANSGLTLKDYLLFLDGRAKSKFGHLRFCYMSKIDFDKLKCEGKRCPDVTDTCPCSFLAMKVSIIQKHINENETLKSAGEDFSYNLLEQCGLEAGLKKSNCL